MDDKLLDLLKAKGLLDDKAVLAIRDLLAQGKSIVQAAVGGKYVSDIEFAKVRAESLGMPFVDLTERIIPKETLELLPQETMDNYHAVPVDFDGKTLQVALDNPQDFQAMQALEFMAADRHWTLRYVVVPSSQLDKLMQKVKGLGAEVATALVQAKGKFSKEGEKDEGLGKLEEVIKGAPVSRMVSVIMRHAVEGGASDIHIEPFGGESRVRYRIDGVLRTSLTLPIYVHAALVSRLKVLANLKIDETRVPQDGRITQDFNGKRVDFRLSTLPVVDNEKIVMRILDTTASAPTLERLGYRKEHIDAIKAQMKKPFGMFLVTGPTGSGKSTTLFSVLNVLNTDGVNISTLEDPVEYNLEGANQSQIRPDIGYTFAVGLRALLRQDPNVIMVGEIRDKETGELGVHAALTGHLLFSTLHTNDVYGIVPRMTDMGLEPFLIAATMNCAIAQRLARRICLNCKTTAEVEPETVAKVAREVAAIPRKYFSPGIDPEKPLVFYKGKGCAKCGDTGYAGRISIAELFEYTDQAKRLIEKGFPLDGYRQERKRQEALSLREDAFLKALDGHTTLAEVFRITQAVQEDT